VCIVRVRSQPYISSKTCDFSGVDESGGGGDDDDELLRRMQRTWQQMLGGIGAAIVYADDDFFELGGNSLDAVRLVQRVNAMQLGASIQFGDVRRASTPRRLVTLIRRRATLHADTVSTHDNNEEEEEEEDDDDNDNDEQWRVAPAIVQQFVQRTVSVASSSWVLPGAIHSLLPLDVTRLRRALLLLVQRHQALHVDVARDDNHRLVVRSTSSQRDLQLQVVQLTTKLFDRATT
jgi:hypothetical protein